MTRNNVFVGDRRVLRRYIGDKLIFDDLEDKTEILSGTEIFTDKADEEAVVHVEIDGKSWQEGVPSPDSPSEIHSLNDFDVVSSVGKRNLIYNTDDTMQRSNNPSIQPIEDEVFGLHRRFRRTPGANNALSNYTAAFYDTEIGKNNTQSIEVNPEKTVTLRIRSGTSTICPAGQWTTLYNVVTATSNKERYWGVAGNNVFDESGNGIWIEYRNEKAEEGNISTPYSLAPEDIAESDNHPSIDKINLLLDEPLRSVGDVHDRLYRDSDGLWKVERNVGELTVKGNDIGSLSIGAENNVIITKLIDNIGKDYSVPFQSSHYKKMTSPPDTWQNKSNIGTGTVATNSRMWLSVNKQTIDTVAKARIWFDEELSKGTPVVVNYQLAVPIIETLSQVNQDKLNNLRTFKDSNYIYTVLPDKSNILQENLKPTLHSTFKSIGWETFRNKLTKEE